MAVQAWKWAFGVGWDRKPWLGWAGEWAFWLSIGLWGLVLRFSERFDFIFTRKHQTPVTTGENCHFSSSGLVNHNFVQLCRSWIRIIRTIRTIRSRIQMAVFLESSFSRKLRIWPSCFHHAWMHCWAPWQRVVVPGFTAKIARSLTKLYM